MRQIPEQSYDYLWHLSSVHLNKKVLSMYDCDIHRDETQDNLGIPRILFFHKNFGNFEVYSEIDEDTEEEEYFLKWDEESNPEPPLHVIETIVMKMYYFFNTNELTINELLSYNNPL